MEFGLAGVSFDLVRQFGYLAVFVFLFLETSMLFPLLPSEVVLPFAAGVIVTDPFGILLFGAVAAGGAVVGGTFAFYVFGEGGNRVVRIVPDRYLDDGDVERARRWFSSYGEWSVLWGRLLPFLRSVISIPAGIARMNLLKFSLYTGVGVFAFTTGVAALVYWGKQQSIYHAAAGYVLANPLVASVAALAGVVLLVVAWRTGRIETLGR